MQRESLNDNNVESNNNRDKGENEKQKRKKLALKRPLIVGYMSTDVMREYHSDLSQLKYLTSIPVGRLHMDLNHNIHNAVKRTTDDSDEKISLMLKFLLDQKEHVKHFINDDFTFITYRRTLISVMCTVYSSTPLSIIASVFQNRIYLCSVESQQEMLSRQTCNQLDKFCAWGYKYEQYMLSGKYWKFTEDVDLGQHFANITIAKVGKDVCPKHKTTEQALMKLHNTPDSKPDINKPVLENEEFSMYYSSQLGDHKLFYGAQIDGMLATEGQLKQIPNNDELEANLCFLRNNRYVELKTNIEIYNRRQDFNFRRFKLLRCWCQCYLAGLKGLLVGFRNNDGIVQRVEWFDTTYITRSCKTIWDSQVTLKYLNHFLDYVKDSFKSTYGPHFDSSTPLTLKFDIDEHGKFHSSKAEEISHIILPDWFVDSFN